MIPSRFIFILLIGLLANVPLQGQDSLLKTIRKVNPPEGMPDKLARQVRAAYRNATDTATFRKATAEAEMMLASEGFAEAALDSHHVLKRTLFLQFHLGSKYYLERLFMDGLSENYDQKWEFTRMTQRIRPLDWRDLERRIAGCLNDFQNEGYPFARFDSLALSYRKGGMDSMLTSVAWRFAAGPLVKIDSIIYKGDKREHDYFLHALTGIKPGNHFDQHAIDNIPRALNNSIYFKNARAPIVEFRGDSAKLTIQIERRKAGRFDLLLGLLPPKRNETKFQFTGLVDFQLVSPVFRAGEIIRFRFDKLVGTSQKMLLQYSHPWLFSTPIRIQLDFDLLKQDTTFLNRNLRFSGYYQISRPLALKLYVRQKVSNLISTEKFEADTVNVPPVLDGKDQLYGLGFEWDNLDYKYNPTRGWVISADFGLGRKRITKNVGLSDNIYKGLELVQPKKEADFQVQAFRSPLRRWVIMAGNRTWWLSQNQYFNNDMAQIGGSRILRGFNENQFFASFYSLFTLENRFILEQNSFLFVFCDYAYLENAVGPGRVLHPYGIGAGMTYETKAGIVTVSYAAGAVEGSTLQPGRGRIHVGLVNQF